ncbi:hypothetical protein AB1N83_003040 [Pleurotus pulmonarius]
MRSPRFLSILEIESRRIDLDSVVRWHTNPAPKLDADIHIRSRPRLCKKPHYNICLNHELGVLSHHSRIISPLNALPASSATDYQRRNQQIVALTTFPRHSLNSQPPTPSQELRIPAI